MVPSRSPPGSRIARTAQPLVIKPEHHGGCELVTARKSGREALQTRYHLQCVVSSWSPSGTIMTKPKRFGTRLVADLRPVFEGWPEPIIVGSDFDGAIYAAARRSLEEPTEPRGFGIFPKSTFEDATDYFVVRCQNGHVQTLIVPQERVVASFVQPFAGGVLLVGARCHWRPGGPVQQRQRRATRWALNRPQCPSVPRNSREFPSHLQRCGALSIQLGLPASVRGAQKVVHSAKQGQYLAYIATYMKRHRRAPAESDMQAFFGVTAPSVHRMVVELERLKLIRRQPGIPRSIELLVPRHAIPALE
jgi:hypothetical protein